MTYTYMHHSWPVVTMRAKDEHKCFADSTHRVVVAQETEVNWQGWPDPTDDRNSEHWQPGVHRPLIYPKFAWQIVDQKGEL